VAKYYPDLVSHVFSIAVPYLPPDLLYIPLDLMAVAMPNLAYQKQMASGIVEKTLTTKDNITSFINSMYYGLTPDGQPGFTLSTGFIFDRLPKIGKSLLLSNEVTQRLTYELHVLTFLRRLSIIRMNMQGTV
jgi:soluble epoxide hydrolase/lipid-phosphate phosphatase